MKHVDRHSYPSTAYRQGQRKTQQKQARRRNNEASGMKKWLLMGAVLVFLLFTGWQLVRYIDTTTSAATTGRHTGSKNTTMPTTITPVSENNLVSKQPPIHFKRPNFEAGIVFPQWTQNGYGSGWQQQLPAIQSQTSARWMEMTIFLTQATPNSTQVITNPSTASLQSFTAGIKAAHAEGFQVFVVPLMGVETPAGQWAGTITFSNAQDEAQWFDSYWQTYQPYVQAAAQAGADQLAIGTELVWLQQNASPDLWNTLISRVHSVFPGPLTYDMNWTTLSGIQASWLSNPLLSKIGVSEYLPLVNTRQRVDPAAMPAIWKSIVKTALDNLSTELNKPVIVSEIGYRNTADAFYNPWLPYSTVSPPDPAEQAGAVNAALSNVIPDSHIEGIFFWGWDGVSSYKLSGQPAADGVLSKWYNSPQA